MNVDSDTIRDVVSLIGSGVALASTFYFWLIRARRERARMEIHPVTPLSGSVLLNEDFDTYRAVDPGEGHVCAKYFLHVAVVNQSTLPNAVLGFRVWMHFADNLWREMTLRPLDENGLPLPTNLPPLTTVSVRLGLGVAVPGQLSGGFREREQAAGDALHPSLSIRVAIDALAGQSFVCEWNDAGGGLLRQDAEATLSKTAA